MSELPAPDILERGRQLRQLVLALIIGAAAGAIAYLVADGLAQPETMHGGYDGGHQARAFGFVFYVTAFFGAGAFITTLAVAQYLAKRKDQRQGGLPEARKIP